MRRTHPSIAIDHLSPITTRTPILGAHQQQSERGPLQDIESTTPLLSDHPIGNAASHDVTDADNINNGALSQSLVDQLNDAPPIDYMDDEIELILRPPSPEGRFEALPTMHVTDWLVSAEQPDLHSSDMANHLLSVAVANRYAAEYFSGAHPMWPFLHQKQWADSWDCWRQASAPGPKAGWMTFIVDMVRQRSHQICILYTR